MKGEEKEEYVENPVRENRPQAGRRFQEVAAEGSFGAGYLKEE